MTILVAGSRSFKHVSHAQLRGLFGQGTWMDTFPEYMHTHSIQMAVISRKQKAKMLLDRTGIIKQRRSANHETYQIIIVRGVKSKTEGQKQTKG